VSSWPSEAHLDPHERSRASLEFLWGRLARPLNVAPAVGALLGVPTSVTRQFVGVAIATSPPAERLLDRMPKLLRSLSISTVDTSVRCVGEIRGPVLWSETMAARSATAGDPGMFVCSTPARAYGTPDNQVLVAALDTIHRGGLEVDRGTSPIGGDPLLRRARSNAARALRFLEHRSLGSVERRRPPRRIIQRARAGGRPSFRLAMAVLDRADEPVEVDHLLPFCTEATAAQHDVLVAVIRQLETHGVRLPAFHIDQHVLRSGPLSYRHVGTDAVEAAGGIRVGNVVFGVPQVLGTDRHAAEAALGARIAAGRSPVLVLGRADILRGIEQALEDGL